jgi:hypothetical protein
MHFAVWFQSEFLGSIDRFGTLRVRFRHRKWQSGEGAIATGSNVVFAVVSVARCLKIHIAVWFQSEFLTPIYRIEPLRARFRQRKWRTGEGARATGSNVVLALFSIA